jgi:oxygen-independent coproporphyrinogen-3 oxidase
VGSVYLGGGTPSTLEPERLREIFAAVRKNFMVERDAEITIECAPGQIAADFLKAMVEVSATRVSLGVQSMMDAEAAATGRMHTREIVQEDVRRLRDAGLAVNVDLIAGLPGQTISSWMQSVEAVCGLGIEHASLYMLEVDEDSRLGRELIGGGARYGAALVPTDDTVAAMYEAGCQRLERAGLAQYEISNFARRGAESRHNLRYWRREPYLGAGLDAHSMLRHQDGGAVRFGNTDELAGYLAGDAEGEVERVDRAAELEESWFLGLRLVEGVSLPALRREFGGDAIAVFEEVVGELVGEGLLMHEGDRVALTMRGRMLSNEVFGRFLGVAAELISTEPRELSLPTR